MWLFLVTLFTHLLQQLLPIKSFNRFGWEGLEQGEGKINSRFNLSIWNHLTYIKN